MLNLSPSFVISESVNINVYKTIILTFVLFWCETRCLTLREEHEWKFFEHRVVRRLFGHKREVIVEAWRRLRNEERCNVYCSPHIVRLIKSEDDIGRGM